MNYINVKEAAKKWNVSERSVRNYCADGKISGAVCQGKVWKIPEDAIKPLRKQRAGKVSKDLLTRLQMEKEAGISGGIYHKVTIPQMDRRRPLPIQRVIVIKNHLRYRKKQPLRQLR